jgi:hypothetical protein
VDPSCLYGALPSLSLFLLLSYPISFSLSVSVFSPFISCLSLSFPISGSFSGSFSLLLFALCKSDSFCTVRQEQSKKKSCYISNLSIYLSMFSILRLVCNIPPFVSVYSPSLHLVATSAASKFHDLVHIYFIRGLPLLCPPSLLPSMMSTRNWLCL